MIDYGAAAADMVAATTICGKYFIGHKNVNIKQIVFNIQGLIVVGVTSNFQPQNL